MMKIPISFKESERDIYNYIKSKRNYSVYIKDLVEADMKKEVGAERIVSISKNKSNKSMEIDI